MRSHLARTSTWSALAVNAVLLAGTQGCGGNEPLQPAHSTSFYPVRGTADSGAAADTLHWVYRINGGQPITSTTSPGTTIQFNDEDVTAEGGSTVKTSVEATLASTNGGTTASGHESLDETDQVTPGSSPATISERDVNLTISVAAGSVQVSAMQMVKYMYTPPQATFFDRDDLDSLAIGFTESQDTQVAVTGTATASATGEATQSQTVSMTIPSSTTWVLVAKLPTLQVLGHDYTNVVEVQTTGTATDPMTATTQQANASIWLAKGIGMIREQESGTTFDSTGPVTVELVSTNLAP
jgi:hypothetical protein